MKTLRIFISSPSDVRAERVRAYDVVQRLQTKFRAYIKLESILWEDEPLRATSTFQVQIPKPSESDVVICVLWARIGMRLPQDYRRADGSIPTGTEWEFEDALASYKTRGTPDLLVYRKTAAPEITVTNNEMVEDWLGQKKALDAFLKRWFQDHDGAFQAAFNTFATDEEFERLLTTHLGKIISVKLDKPATITWTEGSPFRGLDVFQTQHQAIFFGRDLAIAETTNRLLEQSARGRVFLMVLGMSGCGKSSLVRAGILPELMRPGVVRAVGCWRWAVLKPSEASGTLTECLASALFREKSALPELSRLGLDIQRVGALLQEAPAHAIPLIEAALGIAAQQFAQDNLRSKPPEARLILVIDQLEEMFTIERFDASQRAAFVGAVSALSRSGLVWVIATMRSDLYASCAEIEELRALKSDDGQYDLSRPSVSEIGQVIRMPALAAGLGFESHPTTHRRLDDALQEEASRSPEALPLLEFCLDELYKLRTESHLVTWEAYETLGGLDGAITRRAEDVFTALSAPAQQAFPHVLASLVTMNDVTATSRPARRNDIGLDPHAQEVIRAYTQANLFVTDVNQGGEPVVAVAHEALINCWPRVQDWVQENKDFLRLNARIAQAAHLWRESGQEDGSLLPEGKPLAEAVDALRQRPRQLDEIEFVQRSITHARRRKRRRAGLAASVAILVFSVMLGAVLLRQSQRKRAASEVDFATALGMMERNEISGSLAYLADGMRNNPANQGAIALTVSELHDFMLPVLVLQHGDEVQDASFSRDGSRVVTASKDGSAQVWDADSGRPIGQPMKHADTVHTAEFNEDGTLVVTASYDGMAQVWDARTGTALLRSPLRSPRSGNKVYSAKFSPDSRTVVTASSDGTAQVWDAHTGKQVGATMRHDRGKTVWVAVFNPAGTLVVTASADRTARVWDARTGMPVLVSGKPVTLHHADEVNSAVFSPDGKWIVTTSDDGTARLWDARTFEPSGQVMKHEEPVNFASFSRDSEFVVTASSDHTARIWKVPSGVQVGVSMRHDGVVRSATFSADGTMVLTASYDRAAQVWDAQTGSSLGASMRHSGGVYMARFSRDDSSIVTASLDHSAQVWKWHRPTTLPAMKQAGAMESADFDAKGERLVTVSSRGVQVWDSRTCQAIGPLIGVADPKDGVTAASLSADGESLLTTTQSAVQVWNARTGDRIGQPIPVPDLVRATFSPDGHWFITTSHSEVRVWDTHSGKPVLNQPIRHDQERYGELAGASVSPDGRLIATYSSGGYVNLWDAVSGNAIKTREMLHNGSVFSASFSVDGRWLVTASADHTAQVWNVETGAPGGDPMKHDNWVMGAMFSHDGKWIVTASTDQTARVWDARTGQPVSQVMRHKDAVIAARFSPNGRWVVTVSEDGTGRIWDAGTGFPMGEPISRSGKVVSATFSPDSNWVLTASNDDTGGLARIWEAPITAKEAPAWLIDLAERLGGWSLNAQGVLQPSPQNGAGLRERISRPASIDDVARFGSWFAADPATRSVSPRELLPGRQSSRRDVPR